MIFNIIIYPKLDFVSIENKIKKDFSSIIDFTALS